MHYLYPRTQSFILTCIKNVLKKTKLMFENYKYNTTRSSWLEYVRLFTVTVSCQVTTLEGEGSQRRRLLTATSQLEFHEIFMVDDVQGSCDWLNWGDADRACRSRQVAVTWFRFDFAVTDGTTAGNSNTARVRSPHCTASAVVDLHVHEKGNVWTPFLD